VPYPNEHAARLHPPSKYTDFRRKRPDGFPEGVDAIFGIREDGKTEIQAIRAKKDVMTLSEFKRWLSANRFDYILLEEATMSKAIELFSTWTEISLKKADEPNGGGKDIEPRTYICGVVSSDAVDLQGDRIMQRGMEWDYFVKRGWLNYEHLPGPENILGVPTKVEQVVLKGGKEGTYIEGYLLMNRPRVREIVETAKALDGSGRSIGYSVEGQVLQRDLKDPKIITKSRILNVSITAHPVNPDTSLEIVARSLNAVMEPTMEKAHAAASAVAEHIKRMHPELEQKEVLAELLNLINSSEAKAMVGYQTGAVPASSSLSALVPQSLEGNKNMAIMAAEDEEDDSESEDSMDDSDDEDPVSSAVRRVMQKEMASMMQHELSKLMDRSKSDGVKPMVSLAQMDTLVCKVFPTLSPAEQKAFARKLIHSAKGYYAKK